MPAPPRHKDRRCPHGRDISCPHRHTDTDPGLGRAMCPDCYDYERAVLFHAHAADLWRRFTTFLPRHLARLAGLSVTELRALCRVRYVKVAEYQHRSVVHFHAIIRLDAPGDDYQPPPAALRPGRPRHQSLGTYWAQPPAYGGSQPRTAAQDQNSPGPRVSRSGAVSRGGGRCCV